MDINEMNMVKYLFNMKSRWATKDQIIKNAKIIGNFMGESDEAIYSKFNELLTKQWITGYSDSETGETKYYSLSKYGIEEALVASIISEGDIFEKLVDVQVDHNNVLKAVEKFNKEKEQTFNEVNDLKIKLIELMGIFVSIFTLISVNAGTLSLVEKEADTAKKLAVILTINGSLILSIIILFIGINIFIFNNNDNKKISISKIILIMAPIAMIVIGILLG